MVAALFVATAGVYFNRPNVDPWDKARDARAYAGPHPVVAHPPCERWGRYWHGGPSAKERKTKGDDGGCFAAALASVRRWGGVLEHPADSAAWEAFGLMRPEGGGWSIADWGSEGTLGLVGMHRWGWTCRVEQGHFGHRARKATWLYAVDVDPLPSLPWGPSAMRARVDSLALHTHEERAKWKADRALYMRPPNGGLTYEQRRARREWLARYADETGKELMCPERMGRRERAATPVPFAELLIALAESVNAARARKAS